MGCAFNKPHVDAAFSSPLLTPYVTGTCQQDLARSRRWLASLPPKELKRWEGILRNFIVIMGAGTAGGTRAAGNSRGAWVGGQDALLQAVESHAGGPRWRATLEDPALDHDSVSDLPAGMVVLVLVLRTPQHQAVVEMPSPSCGADLIQEAAEMPPSLLPQLPPREALIQEALNAAVALPVVTQVLVLVDPTQDSTHGSSCSDNKSHRSSRIQQAQDLPFIHSHVVVVRVMLV